jgi:flagellar biosynthesis protein FlhG
MPRALQLSRCIVEAFPSTAAARDFRHVAAELPHWPMRPALCARGAGAAPALARVQANAQANAQTHSQANSFVSTVTGAPSAPAPAHTGWRTDPSVQRPAPQHA